MSLWCMRCCLCVLLVFLILFLGWCLALGLLGLVKQVEGNHNSTLLTFAVDVLIVLRIVMVVRVPVDLVAISCRKQGVIGMASMGGYASCSTRRGEGKRDRMWRLVLLIFAGGQWRVFSRSCCCCWWGSVPISSALATSPQSYPGSLTVTNWRV